MGSEKNWVVYLVMCADQSMYCGITKDLEKRLKNHNRGKGAKYTRARTPVTLLGTSIKMTRSEALKLEYRVKKTIPAKKLARLENSNAHMLRKVQKELYCVKRDIQRLAGIVGGIVTDLKKL